MKFIMVVQPEGGRDWEETYDKPFVNTLTKAEAWAVACIENFNATLRPGERRRKLVSVRLAGDSTVHTWIKKTLMTQSDPRLGVYDVMFCEVCGITGKRFGLRGDVKRDSKFRAKKYAECGAKI